MSIYNIKELLMFIFYCATLLYPFLIILIYVFHAIDEKYFVKQLNITLFYTTLIIFLNLQ